MTFSNPLPLTLSEQIRAMAKGDDRFFPSAKPNTVKVIFHRIRVERPGKRFRKKAMKGGTYIWRIR
jgi:hypothetical protein